jgi:hypothetical protein
VKIRTRQYGFLDRVLKLANASFLELELAEAKSPARKQFQEARNIVVSGWSFTTLQSRGPSALSVSRSLDLADVGSIHYEAIRPNACTALSAADGFLASLRHA